MKNKVSYNYEVLQFTTTYKPFSPTYAQIPAYIYV